MSAQPKLSVTHSSNNIDDLQNQRLSQNSAQCEYDDEPLSNTQQLWSKFLYIVTCYYLPHFINKCSPQQRFAWRKKVGLCLFIMFMAILFGFLTFGFRQTICRLSASKANLSNLSNSIITIRGQGYDISGYKHPASGLSGGIDLSQLNKVSNRDLSYFFQDPSSCSIFLSNADQPIFPCTIDGQSVDKAVKISNVGEACHSSISLSNVLSLTNFPVYMPWLDVVNSNNLVVYDNKVLDLNILQKLKKNVTIDTSVFDPTSSYLNQSPTKQAIGSCLSNIATIAQLELETSSCIVTTIIYTSSIIIIAIDTFLILAS